MHFNLQHLRHITTSSSTNSVSLYLQRSKLIDSIRLSLRSNSPQTHLPKLLTHPSLDSFVITNSLRSAPSPDSALSLFQTITQTHPNFTHTQPTLHTLAKLLAKSRKISELHILITEINAGKYTNIPRVTFMELLQFYSIAGDFDSAIKVWNEYRNVVMNNGKTKKHPCTESYNILLNIYVKNSQHLYAVDLFYQMIHDGAYPNYRTYTIVMHHLVSLGKLNEAHEIFETLPSMRIKRTVNQYLILAQGFSGVERFEVVKKLFQEMERDGIVPTQNMVSSLKCLQDAGVLEGLEGLWRELMPDKRIASIGVDVDSSDDEGDENVGKGDSCRVDGDDVRLKPWLDPGALANALSDWDPTDVLALENANFVWTTRLVCKMLRRFKKAETAWKFFCWVAYQPGEFTHDGFTISRMITMLARYGHVELVDQLIMKVKRERIRLSFSTVRLVIDFYGLSKQPDAALRVFYDIETVSGAISKHHQSLLYSSLLRTLVKCKRGSDVMDVLEEMILSGIIPDIQTFSGLMQYFALEGDLKTVQKLFGIVRQSGIEPDAYMFQVLIRAYCKRERAALAVRIYEDMRNSNLIPDSATKALLVKSLWKEGKLREAAYVEEISEDINDMLPPALPGHLWTVSAADLKRVYDIYSNSFASNVG